MSKPRNDLSSPVPRFCFGLETNRRTTEGRVRTAQEFVAHFFPYTERAAEDRIFRFLPKVVRGPILTAWGVRAQKSALRDTDEKVCSVVHDALVAGDMDAAAFEEAMVPELVVGWLDLPDWWAFWRGGKLGKFAILKALEAGYELGLFDAEWFLETLGTGGKLRGTDLLAQGLSKADLTEWVRAIYQSGDASPKGMLAALGWDQVVAKTADESLIAVLDAMALKIGLVTPKPAEAAPEKPEEKVEASPQPPVDSWSPRAGEEAPALALGAPLPGVLIPGTGPRSSNEELEGEAAAKLFNDDEMIPIDSSSYSEEDESADVAPPPKPPSVHPAPPAKTKAETKRSSKVPPPPRAKA